MAKRLTDKEKKKIVASYVEMGSFRAVSRKHGIAPVTVKRICEASGDLAQKVAEKKRQNTEDVLLHMDKQKAEVCEVLDTYLKALKDPDKIRKAGVLQIATAMGIVIDKYTATATQDRALDRLDEVLEKIGGVI